MRSLPLFALAVAAWIPSARIVTRQGPEDPCQRNAVAQAVCTTEAQVTEALRLNDVQRLSQLYADDFRIINYRGRRLDKEAVLGAFRSGALRFDSLRTSDLDIRVYGDVAVVSGIQHQVAREPGGDSQAHPKSVRYTHTYVTRDGRWRLVLSQITPIL